MTSPGCRQVASRTDYLCQNTMGHRYAWQPAWPWNIAPFFAVMWSLNKIACMWLKDPLCAGKCTLIWLLALYSRNLYNGIIDSRQGWSSAPNPRQPAVVHVSLWLLFTSRVAIAVLFCLWFQLQKIANSSCRKLLTALFAFAWMRPNVSFSLHLLRCQHYNIEVPTSKYWISPQPSGDTDSYKSLTKFVTLTYANQTQHTLKNKL